MRFLGLIIVSLTLCSCGGGGGGDGSDVPSECHAYCNTGCSKVALCHGLPQSEIGTCADVCVAQIDDLNNGDADTCRQATANIAVATCAQIDQLLGLRSAVTSKLASESSIEEESTAVQAGQKLAEQ